jgi:membrane protease YdiL (CAAX protease family)
VSWGDALLTAFVLIPVGTILLEEVAFRGVLWGLLRRGRGALTATAVSSALFGLWHVLPSLGLATSNQAVGSTVGRNTSGQALSVLGTVLFTALSEVVFCELRRRSGSLLASAGLHWATNGLGVLASAAVWPGLGARRVARWALAVAAVVLVPLFGVLGARWQHEIRELTGADQPGEGRYVYVVLVSAVITMALLALAGGIRWLVRLVARLHHWDVVPVPVGGPLLAGIGKARFFSDRQRVHVGADQCGRPGAVGEDADHAGAADIRRDVEPRGSEPVARQRCGAMLLQGQLGVGVQIAV